MLISDDKINEFLAVFAAHGWQRLDVERAANTWTTHVDEC